MDAIVLVGGEGTRLRPLTYDAPKQMLPIVDRPLVEHVVSWLGRHGVDRVVLSLGYRPDAFVEAYPDGILAGLNVVYATEPEPLDTAGAVRFAAGVAGVADRFLVVNGDVLTDFDLTSLVSFHHERGGEATIYLTPVADPSAFGVVPTDDRGRVVAFIEKPPSGSAPTNLVNAGAYVLETSVLGRIPSGLRVSIERDTFPRLVADGALFALADGAYWLDTGTPRQYLRAQLDIIGGLRRLPVLPPVPEREAGVFVDPTARLAGDAHRCSYLGPGAVIEAGSELTDALVGAGAQVREKAAVRRSVVMAGADVAEGACLDGAIVGPGASIGRGATLRGMTLVRGGLVVPDGAVLDGARVGMA